MDASVSLENVRPALSRIFWLLPAIVPAALPVFLTLRFIKQNCPCAFLLAYWLPTLLTPHLNLLMVKVQSPALTGVPMPGASGALVAFRSGAFVVGASEAGTAVLLLGSVPPHRASAESRMMPSTIRPSHDRFF